MNNGADFFCKFRDYYLRQNIRKQEFEQMYLFMIDPKVLDISRLEFNRLWLLCPAKHWNREYENLKRILG